MPERKIIPTRRGMGVVLLTSETLDVCVTAEYLKSGTRKFSMHKYLVQSVLAWLWRAHVIDTSHTLRVKTELNRLDPSGLNQEVENQLVSLISDYLEETLGLSPTNRRSKHTLMFSMIIYNPKDPDLTCMSRHVVGVTTRGLDSLKSLYKSPLKHNQFELFLRDHSEYGSLLNQLGLTLSPK